jgi:hypothetical protein
MTPTLWIRFERNPDKCKMLDHFADASLPPPTAHTEHSVAKTADSHPQKSSAAIEIRHGHPYWFCKNNHPLLPRTRFAPPGESILMGELAANTHELHLLRLPLVWLLLKGKTTK